MSVPHMDKERKNCIIDTFQRPLTIYLKLLVRDFPTLKLHVCRRIETLLTDQRERRGERDGERDTEQERERIFLQCLRFVSNIKKTEPLTMNNRSGGLNIKAKLPSTFKSLCLTLSHSVGPNQAHKRIPPDSHSELDFSSKHRC